MGRMHEDGVARGRETAGRFEMETLGSERELKEKEEMKGWRRGGGEG